MANERIQAILKQTRGPVVLDLGAVQHDAEMANRNNWLHDHLVRAFDRVIGVDILGEEIERLNNQGYEMVQADVENMALGVTADTIVAGELIEHLSNPGEMLDGVSKHLKPNGRLILSTPNPWAFVHLKRLWHDSLQVNEEHTAWYGPIVLRQLLARHGFDLVDITGVSPERQALSLTRLVERTAISPFVYTTWVVTAKKNE